MLLRAAKDLSKGDEVTFEPGQSWTLVYLEGQGDLVSRFFPPITQIVTPTIPIVNLAIKSPDPKPYIM